MAHPICLDISSNVPLSAKTFMIYLNIFNINAILKHDRLQFMCEKIKKCP